QIIEHHETTSSLWTSSFWPPSLCQSDEQKKYLGIQVVGQRDAMRNVAVGIGRKGNDTGLLAPRITEIFLSQILASPRITFQLLRAGFLDLLEGDPERKTKVEVSFFNAKTNGEQKKHERRERRNKAKSLAYLVMAASE